MLKLPALPSPKKTSTTYRPEPLRVILPARPGNSFQDLVLSHSERIRQLAEKDLVAYQATSNYSATFLEK